MEEEWCLCLLSWGVPAWCDTVNPSNLVTGYGLKPMPGEDTLSPILRTFCWDCPPWQPKRPSSCSSGVKPMAVRIDAELMVKGEWSRQILPRGSVDGQKRRSCWQSGGRTLSLLQKGNGEAVSVGKKETLYQSEHVVVSLVQTSLHVCQEGSGNVGLVLAFVRWWGFCSPYCSQSRWGFSLPLGQPLLLALSQKCTPPQHRN